MKPSVKIMRVNFSFVPFRRHYYYSLVCVCLYLYPRHIFLSFLNHHMSFIFIVTLMLAFKAHEKAYYVYEGKKIEWNELININSFPSSVIDCVCVMISHSTCYSFHIEWWKKTVNRFINKFIRGLLHSFIQFLNIK